VLFIKKQYQDLIQRLAPKVERRAQRLQGKGAGATSIEEEVSVAVAMLPQQGAVVFDVGANQGLWSRAMLQKAGSRLHRLVAFEPSQNHREKLSHIQDPRIMVIAKAVSNTIGPRTLYMNALGSGLASLTQRDLAHFNITMGIEESIETTRLDEITLDLGISRIDFLKLDIEGHELDALHGAETLLASGVIRALSFEFGGANIDTRTYFRDFWLLLTKYNYKISRIIPGSASVPISNYHERIECFTTTNYIAEKLY
jgi:FkbM family methyltransferase